MADYPTSVFTFTNRQDNVDEVAAADYNGLAAEIAAVESGLETGLQHDLKPDATNTRALGSSSLGWLAFLSAPVFLPTRKTDTGTVNDYALGGFGVVLLNNASDLTITGIAAGKDGELKMLQSVGAGNVFLAHQNTGSVAANRLQNMATSGKTPLAAGVGSALYQYDGTNARWRLLHHEQGGWITPTFSASNFTGNGSMTWTVAGATTCAYRLDGATLSVALSVTGSAGGTLNNQLIVKNGAWGGFTSKQETYAQVWVDDNGTFMAGRLNAAAGATQLTLIRNDNANFASSSSGTILLGTTTFEVQ